MLDIVFIAMFAITPILAWSVYAAARRRKFTTHKRTQIILATVLFVTVTIFEIDLRFFTDWQQRAAASPYYAKDQWNAVWISLVVHLSFAVPTLLLWVYVLVMALRKFPAPPVPNDHSRSHRRNGWLATCGMFMTAITGWIFYWLAFVS